MAPGGIQGIKGTPEGRFYLSGQKTFPEAPVPRRAVFGPAGGHDLDAEGDAALPTERRAQLRDPHGPDWRGGVSKLDTFPQRHQLTGGPVLDLLKVLATVLKETAALPAE